MQSISFCSFSLLARKKKNQKERAAGNLSSAGGLGPPAADYPKFMPPCGVLLELTGRCGTREVYAHEGAQTVLALYPINSVLLGCLKWQKKKT